MIFILINTLLYEKRGSSEFPLSIVAITTTALKAHPQGVGYLKEPPHFCEGFI
jgi:hypothetical protein